MPRGDNRSIVRAISILDCFSAEQPQLGVREVARRLGLAASTVGRLLATLASAGVLTQNRASRTYMLGPRVLRWAGLYTGALDLRPAAKPVLERLRHITGETTTLYVQDGYERVCVECLEGPQSIRAVVRVGERMPLHAGAGGKVLIAFLPADRRAALLRRLPLTRFTPHTTTSRARLERDLATIRRQGYASTVGERFAGAASVAAPVFGADGSLIAAVNVFGPAHRFIGQRKIQYVRQVAKAAMEISRVMGYAGAGHQRTNPARAAAPRARQCVPALAAARSKPSV